MNTQKISAIITNTVGSSKFSIFLILLFATQALWVAVSFSWIIFDERFHFNIIKIYTEHLWPVIYDQPLAYDAFRDFAGEGSKAYHFLMSFPLRVIELWTGDEILQLKLLRFINIGMVSLGLWWFIKLFDQIRIKRIYTNLGLAALIMLPIFSWVGGMVNYDNFIFMITPIFLAYTLRILSQNSIRMIDVLIMIILGMIAALAKFTFLVVFAVAVFAVIVKIWLLHKKKKSIKVTRFRGNKLIYGGVIGVFLIVGALFSQTYIYNTIKYGTPRPDCTKTLGIERCMSNGVIERNQTLLVTSKDKQTKSPSGFFFTFGENVSRTLMYSSGFESSSGKRSEVKPLFFIDIFYLSLMIVLTIAIIMYLARTTPAVSSYVGLYVMIIILVVYTISMFIQGYAIYEKYNHVLAIQGRYLLAVLPIFFILGFHSLAKLLTGLKYRHEIIIGLAIVGLLMMTQGGGIITHIVAAEKGWYWRDSQVETFNINLRDSVRPYVRETYDGN